MPKLALNWIRLIKLKMRFSRGKLVHLNRQEPIPALAGDVFQGVLDERILFYYRGKREDTLLFTLRRVDFYSYTTYKKKNFEAISLTRLITEGRQRYTEREMMGLLALGIILLSVYLVRESDSIFSKSFFLSSLKTF
jgi:hypothetical protein